VRPGRASCRDRARASSWRGSTQVCPRNAPFWLETAAFGDSYDLQMEENGVNLRVLASGATELWAGDVRQGNRLSSLGEDALEVERPLHVAIDDELTTLCGARASVLVEYPIDFAAQEPRFRCPICDEKLDHPTQ
jgi:hypothetical protein